MEGEDIFTFWVLVFDHYESLKQNFCVKKLNFWGTFEGKDEKPFYK